jgi:sigma-B regulation protein RsbU (phosphoserine phosphatase)
MPAWIPPQVRLAYKKLGWPERIFFVLVLLDILLGIAAPKSEWFGLIRFLAIVFGFIVLIKLLRAGIKRAIWRLRNRLLVTYLFIAVVPVTLVAALAALGAWTLISQFALFLVTSELDRRLEALRFAAANISRLDTVNTATLQKASHFAETLFPGIEIVCRNTDRHVHYPPDSVLDMPPTKLKTPSGILLKDGKYYGFASTRTDMSEVLVAAPITRHYLSGLIPNLGVMSLFQVAPPKRGESGKVVHVTNEDVNFVPVKESDASQVTMPAAAWQGDVAVMWWAEIPVVRWNGSETSTILQVRSRPSAVFAALFSRKGDALQGVVPILLLSVSILFLIVELASLIVGISMTRTVTGAVHRLYEATLRVREGDFGHRIEVKGKDQLAELGHSFNTMTERMQDLLVVAKEKERLQSEIEIAREVQSQLYPKKVPDVKTLRLTAVCKPARMVSGDYFDYECVRDRVAIAVGDVAGKGISAALLMATLQSSLRTELRGIETVVAAAGGNGVVPAGLSTSTLVSHLNQQLYSYTSPEKYATFYLAIYDEPAGMLTYTNAGHLPPFLIRKGQVIRLNVDGTVVGAFPFAQYDESRIGLEPNDLLVCFTDGVTEPENVYGEMFGEERLLETITRNAHRPESEIIEVVTEAVQQWTGSPELQDDMTLLLARRV